MVVAVERADHTAPELRRLAAVSRDAPAARRMLALALVLEGVPRAVAAQTCGMDRQTLRDWVHRYNDEGLSGLSNRKEGVGRKPLLTADQVEVVAELVRTGPDLATHGVVRWRRADLAGVIEQRFGVRPDVRTVGKLLHRLGFRRLSVRPRHPAHDAAAQEAHKKTSPPSSPRRSRTTPEASRSNSGGRTKQGLANKAP